MFSLFIAAIFKVALPLLFIIALIDALTMSRTKRARVMRRSGDPTRRSPYASKFPRPQHAVTLSPKS